MSVLIVTYQVSGFSESDEEDDDDFVFPEVLSRTMPLCVAHAATPHHSETICPRKSKLVTFIVTCIVSFIVTCIMTFIMTFIMTLIGIVPTPVPAGPCLRDQTYTAAPMPTGPDIYSRAHAYGTIHIHLSP